MEAVISISRSSRYPTRFLLTLLLLATSALVGACASGGSGASSGGRDVITAEQLEGLPTLTAYEVVRRLKPTWLRTRGQDTFRGSFSKAVIVDGVRRGGLDVLHRYNATALREIRYLDARRAQLRFGDLAGAGAILLITVGS